MKLILENWNRFLNENEIPFKEIQNIILTKVQLMNIWVLVIKGMMYQEPNTIRTSGKMISNFGLLVVLIVIQGSTKLMKVH